jgi:hypothetical protein
LRSGSFVTAFLSIGSSRLVEEESDPPGPGASLSTG